MTERRININNTNICLVINNIITQQTFNKKYNVTINCLIENIGTKNIELYYYWTIDEDLNILDTSYIRYNIKGVILDWDEIDSILSNIAMGELHDKILYDNFSKMNI
jgi:hypothetical protein